MLVHCPVSSGKEVARGCGEVVGLRIDGVDAIQLEGSVEAVGGKGAVRG